MRILVLEAPARDEVAGRDQSLDDDLVGVALLALVGDDLRALEARRLLGEAAIGIDGVGDAGLDAALGELTAVGHPDVEVLAAVAGRGVDEAGAGIVRDMVAVEEGDVEVVAVAAQGVCSGEAGQLISGNIGDQFERFDLGGLKTLSARFFARM